MRITQLRIRNFRSIDDLPLFLGPISVICGPNSCGKSNVMRAIEFAFRTDVSKDDIYKNMITKKRDMPGAPTLSIWIEMWFSGLATNLHKIAKAKVNDEVKYQFRAYRNGKVKRTLNDIELGADDIRVLQSEFHPVYIPTIRDPSSGGMVPFQLLFADVLRRSRGDMNIGTAATQASSILKAKAESVLREHKNLAGDILHSTGFEVTTDGIDLEHLYREVGISVILPDGSRMPLESLGTGHQSLFIIHLYRQLGQYNPGHSLYLFEEPDNHLHPTTVRAMAADLIKLSEASQVIVSTHSPMLVNLLGLENARTLYLDSQECTAVRDSDLGGYKGKEKELRHLLMQYGVRATEPLFAKRIVIVEGPSDLYMLARLVELRFGRTPDQMDVLFVNAGGKDGVVKLIELFTALGTDWRAVLDWDAAYSAEVPYTANSLNNTSKIDVIKAINSVSAVMVSESRRGRKAVKMLEAIKSEVENGSVGQIAYDGSVVEKLVKLLKKLSAVDIAQLREAIKRRRKTQFRMQMAKVNTWLWCGTIEEMVLSNHERCEVVEQLFISKGKLKSKFHEDRQKHLCGVLHNSGHDVSLLSSVVEQLEKKGLFARSEVNLALDFVMDGLK